MVGKSWAKLDILKKWENYNIDIPLGRKMFRQHFEKIVKDSQKGILERIKENEKEEIEESQEDNSLEREILL